eukprot:Skav224901  [mRNA]  locus=scaffold1112:417867:420845:- [translate_table: standard]
MHLCDFGANLDICEGPGTTVPGCQGPGGAGGMPIYWKVIIFLVVFLPKLALCHYVLLEGTLLLMDTSGILDCVLGALSMSFVLSIDEMLYDAMTSGAAVSIMKKLEAALEEEEIAQEKAEVPPLGQMPCL